MENTERVRHCLSTVILWCVFLALYAGGTFLLVIGLIFAAQAWWAAIHQHESLWALQAKTANLFVMAAGISLIVIIPILQRGAGRGAGSWRAEKRSEMKSGAPAAE